MTDKPKGSYSAPSGNAASGKKTSQRAAYVALAFCWTCWTVNFMARFMVSISLPLVEQEFAITHAMSGLLVTAVIVCYSFSTVPAGVISRRIGARRSIFAYLLLLVVVFLAIWWAQSYAALLLSMVLLGMVLGIYLPSAVSLISGWFAGRRLGAMLGIHETAVSSGKIIGAFVVGILVACWGEWRLAYLVMVPVVVGLALWSFRVKEKKLPSVQTTGRAAEPRRDRRALWYLAPFVLNLFVSFGVVAMFTAYLVEVFALDMGTASAVFAIIHMGGLVGVVVGGAMSDRFGRTFTMLLLLSVTTATLILIYMLPFGAPIVLLWALVNFTTTAYFPVTFAFISEASSPASPAPLIGIFTGIGTLLGGTSPTVIGAVGDAFGLRIGMFLPAVIGAVGLLMLVILYYKFGRETAA